MTVEELAAAVSVTTRTVQRHMAGTRKPLARHLAGYERLFSKLLKRRIVIEKRS
jgi:predicted transcriptional regulator